MVRKLRVSLGNAIMEEKIYSPGFAAVRRGKIRIRRKVSLINISWESLRLPNCCLGSLKPGNPSTPLMTQSSSNMPDIMEYAICRNLSAHHVIRVKVVEAS